MKDRFGLLAHLTPVVEPGQVIYAKPNGNAWRWRPVGCHCEETSRVRGHTTEAAAQLCAARLRGGE